MLRLDSRLTVIRIHVWIVRDDPSGSSNSNKNSHLEEKKKSNFFHMNQTGPVPNTDDVESTRMGLRSGIAQLKPPPFCEILTITHTFLADELTQLY